MPQPQVNHHEAHDHPPQAESAASRAMTAVMGVVLKSLTRSCSVLDPDASAVVMQRVLDGTIPEDPIPAFLDLVPLLQPEHIKCIITERLNVLDRALDNDLDPHLKAHMRGWTPEQITTVTMELATVPSDRWSLDALLHHAQHDHPESGPAGLGYMVAQSREPIVAAEHIYALSDDQRQVAADAAWSHLTGIQPLDDMKAAMINPKAHRLNLSRYHTYVALAMTNPPRGPDDNRILGIATECAARGYDGLVKAIIDARSVQMPQHETASDGRALYAMAMCFIGSDALMDSITPRQDATSWFNQDGSGLPAWKRIITQASWSPTIAAALAALISKSRHQLQEQSLNQSLALVELIPDVTASQIRDTYTAMVVHANKGRVFRLAHQPDDALNTLWKTAVTMPSAAIAMVDAMTHDCLAIKNDRRFEQRQNTSHFVSIMDFLTSTTSAICPSVVTEHIERAKERVRDRCWQ